MTIVKRPQAGDALGDDSGHGERAWGAAVDHTEKSVVSPELVSRFHALIDEVTEELMQGKDADRHTCRADAIALLVATSEQSGGAPEGVESPLRYLLLEEQQKAVAALGPAGHLGQAVTFYRLC